MSNLVNPADPLSGEGLQKLIVQGDLSVLSPEQKVAYYKGVCESLELNYLTKPFEYIRLNGKETLYVKSAATEQLRHKHKISIQIVSREAINDVYMVVARATDLSGRTDEAIGCVSILGLKPIDLANAFMKAETKAKRRVTLSIAGLGFLDESETEDAINSTQNQIKERVIAATDSVSAQFESNRAEIARQELIKKDTSIIDRQAKSAEEVKEQIENLRKKIPPLSNAVDENFLIKFGKYKGMKVSEVQIDKLKGYIDFIETEALKTGKELKGQVLEFIEKAGAYVDSRDPAQAFLNNEEEIPF